MASSKFVLVTGGAGYIGSHTAKLLALNGFTPVVYDNLANGHREAVRWGPFVHADLNDSTQLRLVFRQFPIHAVIHFAAFAYVGESMHQPGRYFKNNLTNALLLLEAMREAAVDKIVFSSTCATYGTPLHIPIAESHPQSPINPYGESKRMVERALEWYGVAHGLRAVMLRYFNAAGADPDGDLGENHDPETHLIPLAIQAALQSRGPLQVFGTDYPTPDGTAIRDYIHVTDLAHAHLAALHYLSSDGPTRPFNLGTGHGISVRQVIEMVEQVSHRHVPLILSPRRPGDPAALVCDPQAARDSLLWQPRFSSLQTIIETAWRWHTRPTP